MGCHSSRRRRIDHRSRPGLPVHARSRACVSTVSSSGLRRSIEFETWPYLATRPLQVGRKGERTICGTRSYRPLRVRDDFERWLVPRATYPDTPQRRRPSRDWPSGDTFCTRLDDVMRDSSPRHADLASPTGTKCRFGVIRVARRTTAPCQQRAASPRSTSSSRRRVTAACWGRPAIATTRPGYRRDPGRREPPGTGDRSRRPPPRCDPRTREA